MLPAKFQLGASVYQRKARATEPLLTAITNRRGNKTEAKVPKFPLRLLETLMGPQQPLLELALVFETPATPSFRHRL